MAGRDRRLEGRLRPVVVAGEIARPAEGQRQNRMPGRRQAVLELGGRFGGGERTGGIAPRKARAHHCGCVADGRPVGERLLRVPHDGQRFVGLGPLSGHALRPSPQENEARVLRDSLGGEALEAANRLVPAAEMRVGIGKPLPGDEPDRCVDLAGGEGVADGRVRLSLLGEPLVRALVELGDEPGLALRELGAEQIGEELVVAVPLAAVVERNQEEVRALELRQARRRATPPGHRVAERSRERVEDRGLEQEVPLARVQRAENDLGQVVDDVAVRAVEGGYEPVRIGALTQGERREVDPGGPALGAPVQDLEALGAEPEGQLLVQEDRLLVLRETEVERAQLEQARVGAELRDRDRRIGAARDDELDVPRLRLHEVGERGVAGRVVDRVVVVEDEDELARKRLELPDDDRDQRVVHVDVAGLERDLRGVSEIRADAADRLDDPGPERDRVAVGGVGGEPGERALVELAPLREEGRLPEPRRRGEEDERCVRADEPGAEPRAHDHLGRGREAAQLRFQEKADAAASPIAFTEEGPPAHPSRAPSCSGGATNPSRTARTAACVLELTPILRRTFDT